MGCENTNTSRLPAQRSCWIRDQCSLQSERQVAGGGNRGRCCKAVERKDEKTHRCPIRWTGHVLWREVQSEWEAPGSGRCRQHRLAVGRQDQETFRLAADRTDEYRFECGLQPG